MNSDYSHDNDQVVIRCEEIIMSGSLRRNILAWEEFKGKRTGTNHRRGPFHKKAPSRIFQRAIRGMIKYKTQRGFDALNLVQVHIFFVFFFLLSF